MYWTLLSAVGFFLCINATPSESFLLSMSSAKTIYDIPNSGWRSPEWNWGYAMGTGHDCAAVCRRQYQTRKSREKLLDDLLKAGTQSENERNPKNFEEVKLILALAWQNGRWDGSDGGRGGYGQVLVAMAGANRYENESDKESSKLLVNDMAARFHLLGPTTEEQERMVQVSKDVGDDHDASRRQCSALVLQAMGFLENGL